MSTLQQKFYRKLLIKFTWNIFVKQNVEMQKEARL